MTDKQPTSDATIVAPPGAADTMPGQMGRYRIESVLGRGSMGVVYKGFDPALERHVAIKTVLFDQFDAASQAHQLARLQREAKAAARLNHPGIVSVYEFGEHQSMAFIAMEYVEGRELEEVISENGRLEPQRALRIISDLLDALAFAHENGIVHRDIKPANIIVTGSGQIKIADFGVAKLDTSSFTQDGTVLGTPAYMSPEQCLGSAVDARSDLFSVGAILYRLLTGEKPFAGDGIASVIQQVLNEEPRQIGGLGLDLPPALDRVLARALAKRADDRFQTAREFKAVLDEIGQADQGQPTPGGKKGPWLGFLLGALLVAALGAGGYWWHLERQRGVESPAIAAPETETEVEVATTVTATAPQPAPEIEPARPREEPPGSASVEPPPLAQVPLPETAPVEEPIPSSALEPVLEPAVESAPTSALAPLPEPALESAPTSALAPVPAPAVESAPTSALAPVPEPTVESAPTSAPLPGSPASMPIYIGIISDRGAEPVYDPGEKLTALVSVSQESYLYCFYEDAEGSVMRILPNRFSAENKAFPDAPVQLPRAVDGFDILMETSGGTERLLCAASLAGLEEKTPLVLLEDLTPLGLTLEQIASHLLQLPEVTLSTNALVVQIR